MLATNYETKSPYKLWHDLYDCPYSDVIEAYVGNALI